MNARKKELFDRLVTTMNNNEYRKNRKALMDQGCTANSFRPLKHFSELSSKTDNDGVREFEPAGFEESAG